METNRKAVLERSRPSQAILWGGLIAGVLDIVAAAITTVLRGGKPIGMLQAIASGVLGRSSFQGGLKTAALGLLLHFVIAFGATIVYFAASRKLKFMVTRPIISGLLYGILVWCFMNLVVLPLSAVTFKVSFKPSSLAIGMGVLMFCVGLPIALIVSHYSKTSADYTD